MAESTTTTEITQAEWAAARTAGLLFAAPGTNAQDAAIHKFAVTIRAEVLDALIELADIVQSVIDGDDYKFDSFTLQPAREAILKAKGGNE